MSEENAFFVVWFDIASINSVIFQDKRVEASRKCTNCLGDIYGFASTNAQNIPQDFFRKNSPRGNINRRDVGRKDVFPLF